MSTRVSRFLGVGPGAIVALAVSSEGVPGRYANRKLRGKIGYRR